MNMPYAVQLIAGGLLGCVAYTAGKILYWNAWYGQPSIGWKEGLQNSKFVMTFVLGVALGTFIDP